MVGGLDSVFGKTYMSIEKVKRPPVAVKTEPTGAFEQILNRSSAGTYSASGLDAIFEKAASAYDISLDLLKAVAKAESDFDPSCVSESGAMGVMQLMPGTAKELGVTNCFDPEQNIMGGAKYLKKKLTEYDGNIELALAAYNAGSGSVKKYGGIPPYAETQNYVKKIMGYLKNGY